jgi:hypothetical protein
MRFDWLSFSKDTPRGWNTRIARLHRNALVLRLSQAMVRARNQFWFPWREACCRKSGLPDSAAAEWLQEGDELENDDASW